MTFKSENELKAQLYKSLNCVQEESHSIELSGDGDPRTPYSEMKATLSYFMWELTDLEQHIHEFDEDNDYCITCGFDGRA